MTIGELQKKFPGISWMDYINRVLDGAETVTKNDIVLLGVPKYINGLQKLLHTTPKRFVV